MKTRYTEDTDNTAGREDRISDLINISLHFAVSSVYKKHLNFLNCVAGEVRAVSFAYKTDLYYLRWAAAGVRVLNRGLI